MSKRSNQFQLKQPAASKKPKLDIEIIPSQQYNPQPTTSNAGWKPKTAVSNASKVDALWGDEDDVFIVLASQAAEEMMQQSQAANSSNQADITFGKFCRNVESSTQAVSKPPSRATDKQLAELFADGEDDVFTEKFDDNYENIGNKIENYFDNEFDEDFNLDEFRQEEQKPPGTGGSTSNPPPPVEFKVPIPVAKASTNTSVMQSTTTVSVGQSASSWTTTLKHKTSTTTHTAGFSIDSEKAEQAAKENTAKKQEHAKDIQVKYLIKRLEQLEKNSESLQREYNELLEKTKIKDGEVSMLRYELKTVKGTNEHMRMEKIREKETIQKEWVEQQKELEKVITALRAELNFKEMEVMNLRMKRLSNSKRILEVRENSNEVRPEHERVTEQSFILCNLLPRMSISEQELPLTLDREVFTVSSEGVARHGKKRKYCHYSRTETSIAHLLLTLQTTLSQVVSQAEANMPKKLSAQMLSAVKKATEEAFDEITQYCQRLVPAQTNDGEINNKPGNVGRPVDPRQGPPTSKMDLVCPTNIFQQDELFPGEQVRVIRRFLAILGLFCRISNELIDDTLLQESRINLLARDIKLISSAGSLNVHHGMITGAAVLLKGISCRLHRLKTFSENGAQLITLFRSIVLCQTAAPSLMVELSEFLRRLSSRSDDAAVLALLNQLCRSNQAALSMHPKVKYRMKTISFSEQTCTLQMYATLLEASVREHVLYEGWQLRLLMANTSNTIGFLRNVLVPSPVDWVQNFIVGRSCNLCHIRMVAAFLVLLHRVLQCWQQRTVISDDDMEQIYGIARNASLLLYDLFGTAYCSKLLQLGGEAVKYHLRIIYNWLTEHQKLFKFEAVHEKTLERLDLQLLMNDPLKSNHEADAVDVKTEPAETEKIGINGKAELLKRLHTDFFKNKFCYQG